MNARTHLSEVAWLAIILAVLAWSWIGAYDPGVWVMEVLPVFIAVPVLAFTRQRFPLTSLVYALILVHAIVLMVGGHYTYARVPLGFWLQEWFDFSRNHYDRIGHLAQGFIPAMVAREILLRQTPLQPGGWLFTLVTSVALARASTAAPTEQAPEGSTTNSHSPTGTPSTPAPGQSYKPVTTDLSGPPPSDPLELLGSLATLLGEHRQRDIDAPLLGGTRSIASFTPREATSTYSASALLDALNRMQQQSANDLSQRLSRPQQVEGLKADLQQQLEAHSELPGQQKVSDQEADVIDLVGMLFDFILDDDNLPDTCKTTLSHLHTPYLKVALQDKALFTQHHHPARRLLNAMAQAGVLYGGEGDERGLLAKMQWVVERVIHDFFGDLQLFNNLLEEFNEFVATLRHKVELRERRAVEAAKGRDKLLGARQHAVEVIGNSLNNRQPPTIIRNFLELTWADVLVFVLLRNGEQSPEWQRACEAAEQLAWSGTLLDDAGRERLQKLRVPLLEDLRKGLELLGGYHEDGIRRLLQDLVACQHAVQAKQPQVAAQLKPILPESPLGAMLGEDAALATLAPRESTLSTRALALAKELGHIEFGTWFEFVNGEQVRTLKLSWFSPTTRNYMFVDQSGQRVAIKPLTQLATEMEQGLARIVTPERGAPLVDRALTAIYRVLQRFTGRTAEPQE